MINRSFLLHSLFLLVVVGILGYFNINNLHAQYDFVAENLTVDLSTDYPKAREAVTVRLTSYNTDLNRASIAWYVNGSLQKQGMGVKSHTITTGAVGSVTSIEVVMKIEEGATIRKSILIRPAEVDLFWEAYGTTPSFYKGKTLYSRQGVVKVTATPHIISGGRKLDPQTLIYKWRNGSNVIDDQSGYGKHTITLESSIISRPLNLEVTVTSVDSNYTAQGFITITPTNPGIFFYEEHPLYGVLYNKALTSYDMTKDEISILAEPYFFSTSSKNDFDIFYDWTMNGGRVFGSTNRISLRKPEDVGGVAVLDLSIKHFEKILQFTRRQLSISFN